TFSRSPWARPERSMPVLSQTKIRMGPEASTGALAAVAHGELALEVHHAGGETPRHALRARRRTYVLGAEVRCRLGSVGQRRRRLEVLGRRQQGQETLGVGRCRGDAGAGLRRRAGSREDPRDSGHEEKQGEDSAHHTGLLLLKELRIYSSKNR